MVPADGQARGVKLRSQKVTITLVEDAAGAWADTDLRMELYNPGQSDIVLTLGVPGPQSEATSMPAIKSATVNADPLILTPSNRPERPDVRATGVVTIPVKSGVDVAISYRQALVAREDLIGYTYMLTAGNAWKGPPESIRVVVSFGRPVSPERIMHLAPAPHLARPDEIVWEWEARPAPSNIQLAYLTSAAWDELVAERAAAAASPGFAEHVALARSYWRLSTLPAPGFAPRASFYHRYVYQSIAEWRAAISSASDDTPAADLAAAREELAGVYLAHGARESGPVAQSYLLLAADELEAASTLDPADEDLASSAAMLQERLADAAQARQDPLTAAAREARSEALDGRAQDVSPTGQLQRMVLVRARVALESGNPEIARKLLSAEFGGQVMAAPGTRSPQVAQALVDVSTTRTRRVIVLRVAGEAQDEQAAALIAAAHLALRDLAPVAASREVLTVTLDYDDPAALLAWQGRLRAALPASPELAILADVLSPRHLAWPVEDDYVTRLDRYVERVDLARCAAAWQYEAGQLERAAGLAETSGKAVDQLRAALWRLDAAAWRRLAGSSGATYRLEMAEGSTGPAWLLARAGSFLDKGQLSREWVVQAGDARQLETAIRSLHYERAALAAGAVLAAVLLFLAIFWLARRAVQRSATRRRMSETDRISQEHV